MSQRSRKKYSNGSEADDQGRHMKAEHDSTPEANTHHGIKTHTYGMKYKTKAGTTTVLNMSQRTEMSCPVYVYRDEEKGSGAFIHILHHKATTLRPCIV